MSDDAGIGDPSEQSTGDQGAGHANETTGSSRSHLSRRGFLRAAVAGGVAIGVASLGYWGVEAEGLPPFSVPSTPKPSNPKGTPQFRSRPDLSSPFISVTTPGLHAAAGQLLLTPAAGPGPILVDNTGAAVWINPTPGKRAFNLRVGMYRGAPVLTWWEASST